MSRMYSAVFEGVAVSAAQDLFEILAASTTVVRLHRVEITNDDSETSEQLKCRLVRGEGSVTSGSGGSTVTPRPLSKGDAAAGATVEINNTTKMVTGSGNLRIMARRGFNVLNGWLYAPTPEERIDVSPGDRLTVELVSAPGASINLSGEIIFEEIGG